MIHVYYSQKLSFSAIWELRQQIMNEVGELILRLIYIPLPFLKKRKLFKSKTKKQFPLKHAQNTP